ncbi:MAG: DUF2322 family protein [Candidatus Methylopumilus sp.]|nr:DUF2322 family protein [Candidatus Methylopumilus sp.]
MQKFSDILLTLDNADHIDRIEIYKNKSIVSVIDNKPGSQGSIKVYQHLWKLFGAITLDAAIEGLDLYSEHTADAQNNPGKHPNIDRLLSVIEKEEPLDLKIIKN